MLLLCLSLALASCGEGEGDDEGTSPLTTQEVAAVADNYAALVLENYQASLAGAQALDAAIAELLADPSEDTLTAAREAWLAAREPYGQTEVFRFYDGPIDDPDDGPEGQLNAWPMDEAYIDYVDGAPDAGIINDSGTYPTIDAELLASLNEAGGETNISTGYHAIEFLLWGQDLSADGPGQRPFTDFVTDGGGTAANQDRRGAYLAAVSGLLVDDLSGLVAQWEGAGEYRAQFVAEGPEQIVRKILLGMGSLGGAELAGERIEVALDTRDQEDEHSCFSDNTHRDIVNNAKAIQNVYLGSYGAVSGPGIDELVAARDQALADQLRDEIAASVAAAEAIPAPFDRAIDGDEGGQIAATVAALRAQTETIEAVADALGVALVLE